MKVKISDREGLVYRTFLCLVCKKQLFRTIENRDSQYYTPSIIVDCNHCKSKFHIKYTLDSNNPQVNLINIQK